MRLDDTVDADQRDGQSMSKVQLPVTFSDQIIVVENGPTRDCCYHSRLEYVSDRNYMESVLFKPCLVPVKYRTTVIVDNSINVLTTTTITTTSDDSESPDETPDDVDQQHLISYDVKFYEEIYLVPKMVAKHFGSTVYSYPKESKKSYETVFNYNVNSKDRIYVTGLNYPSGVNILDLGQQSILMAKQSIDSEDGNCMAIEGKLSASNGNGFINGNSNGDQVEEIDDQLFLTTKELTIIKGIAVTSL